MCLAASDRAPRRGGPMPNRTGKTHANPGVRSLEDITDDALEPPHHVSITEVAGEAGRTGLGPISREEEEIPGEDDLLRAGDPDSDPMQTEFSGESAPGMGMDS